MRFLVFLITLCVAYMSCTAQETVYFTSSDQSKVTGRLFIKNSVFPFILLVHGEDETEEFSNLCLRILNLNYNCLSIAARSSGIQAANSDIDAAVAFLKKMSNLPVILMGSTRLASACLVYTKERAEIRAVIAFSPGEYFRPFLNVSDAVKGIEQPVFVSASTAEYPYIQKMLLNAGNNFTLFKSEKVTRSHGSGVFSESNPSGSEYWFALMMFFKQLEYSAGTKNKD